MYVDVIQEKLTVNQFVNRVAEAYFGLKYLTLDDILASKNEVKNPARIKELDKIAEMIHGKNY